MKVLLKFNHGLGDCVQFTSVLLHLRKHKPDWKITVQTNPGKHSTAIGLCERSTSDKNIEAKEKFNLIKNVSWMECFSSYGKYPSTKVERCLLEEFKIEPDPTLCYYSQEIREEALHSVRAYLRAIGAKQDLQTGRWDVVTLHYQGNTSSDKKNITHENALIICNQILSYGLIPIILDWDNRSPLPNNKDIFCPDKTHPLWDDLGTGDAEKIAALISLSRFFIGIDSGPGHSAGTTNTPSLLVWNKHHPINYYHPMKNVVHLIPHNHESFVHAGGNGSITYFNANYQHTIYTNLSKSLIDGIKQMVEKTTQIPLQISVQSTDGLIKSGDFWIREDNAEQDMVIIRDLIGNDAYKLKLIPGIIQRAKFVIDVGAHIGCFAYLIHKLNPSCKIACVEVCPENISALRKNVGDFAQIFQAACTYEQTELMLLNAVRPNCESTGGSTVIQANLEDVVDRQKGYKYWPDRRVIQKLTLEQIMQLCGQKQIDLLKLDCEGSEFSILGKTTSRDYIRFIVGEYHDKDRWNKLREERFSQWDYGKMYTGTNGLGLFHLDNRNFTNE